MERKPYPTDLTDEQWKLIEPLLPDAKPGGRPRTTILREVLNALFYLVRSGCQWRMIPHEFPPWKTCYNYYRAWIDNGTWDELVATLRMEVRTEAGRDEQPRVAAIDSQSVKTTEQGGEGFVEGMTMQIAEVRTAQPSRVLPSSEVRTPAHDRGVGILCGGANAPGDGVGLRAGRHSAGRRACL